MGSQIPKSARFGHPTSDFHDKYGSHQNRSRLSPGSILESIERKFSSAYKSVRRIITHLSFKHPGDQSVKKPKFWKKILDPQKPFLQQWNKIFVLSSVIAVAVDPLFFYIPVIDGERQCLTIDRQLMIIACVLRSVMDLFYVLHMIFEFRTGFLPPSLPVFGSGELIEDPAAIAKRYLLSNFLIDILSVLPLPQLLVLAIIPAAKGPIPLKTKDVVKIAVLLQYVPRLLRIYPLYREVTRTVGILTETAWSGAAFNLLIYMQVSHVVGAIWYLLSVERQAKCWVEACRKDKCKDNFLYCGNQRRQIQPYIDQYCSPKEPEDGKTFNFGMYVEALKFQLTSTTSFRRKFFYSFWWALRNVSSSGQNLQVSNYMGEVFFAVFIAILGLVLFALLISNIQKYLQSATVKVEQMRINRRDAEHWMAHRMLPEDLRQRIRRYDQYKWQLNRGVKEEELIGNLPKDLRRDIKRHLCYALLKKVPLFSGMDKQLLDAMCEYLKPVLFTEKSFILQEGDPIDMMLFIMKGKLATIITYGWKNDTFSAVLNAGDFCGEELVQWARDPTSTSLPISSRTVKSLTEVEAFALKANELKSVTSQFHFQRLNSKQFQLSVRFYSHQWNVWAAYKIQEAWQEYRERKRRGVRGDGRFQAALAKTAGASVGFGATLYASIFISHLLQVVQRDQHRETVQLTRVMTLPPPPKPDDEPDRPNVTILNL
ncbi:cyclic nucleotide-gated ion channel 1-like isoform X1 [Cucurbita maxima]|uniref:Cyclic nucleotide-gated ion channel 1-like isoform X1 n=1 Tax=Cucurbita maxima TaxID=3661 RepID=A0A6J1IV06_CUCMA|nr:cyclic nucleotide-gated ion channel 1-like isoform X1 [Cucurbita maxima]XP_022980031.1 cyclic nucleotide-gated ion channel 1-like isoform X1 [Cucurbita maxima]XP_022980033.1 cyclic nucleotide-gated ion channel 1-like isoform X1 [Cucurbita maxima]XP_022980034.1 cyclic nucleotide-gated ion channel 1-like isoform X1 [Cucurbita maxima]